MRHPLLVPVVTAATLLAGCGVLDPPGAAEVALPEEGIDVTSTEVPLLVTEVGCASGRPATGRVELVDLEQDDEEVRIRIGVRPLRGSATCPGNPATPFTVDLDGPLGSRALVDLSSGAARTLTDGGGTGRLACPSGEVVSGSAGLEAGAVGTSSDPVDTVRDWAPTTRPDDVLTVREETRSGAGTVREVLVGRAGRVVAVVHLVEGADGTLLVSGYDACADDDVRWP